MLDTQTKKRIDDCRDILVGKLPDPKAQIEQITIGLIYKFMYDMDKEAVELGGKVKFFADYIVPDPEFPNDRKKDKLVEFSKYSWERLFDSKVTASEMLSLYSEAILSMDKNPNVPQLFRDIFKNAYLPYRDPETLKMFLKTIGEFEYTHSEKLGDAFEYLLSVMGSQGDAGQFRTPRHIIDFLVSAIDPDKADSIADPACGTAGFLISAYKHILLKYTKANKEGLNIYQYNKHVDQKPFNNLGDLLTPDNLKKLNQNFVGYDISPDMVRLSLVNLYLHGFPHPHIYEYDTLSSEDRWNESFDVILANPPFMTPKGGIRPHKRFGVQANKSEVLFTDYIAEHLNNKGRAGIVVPNGIVATSQTAYKQLRKMLVKDSLIAVISLPAGVFQPYSGVKTSIMILDKTLAKKSKHILFLKIDNDGYDLGAQRREIEKNDLPLALELLDEYKKCLNGDVGNLDDFFDSIVEKNQDNPSVTKSKVQAMGTLVEKEIVLGNKDVVLSAERYFEVNISQTEFEVVKIGNVFKTSSGGTPLRSKLEYYTNGTIPWLKSGEVAQGNIYHSEEFITDEGLKNSSAKQFPINSVLVAMYGATAGQVGILKIEATTNQAVCAIYPNEKAIPEYLYWILKQQTQAFVSLSGGGGQPNISQQIIRDFEIPLPPLEIQQQIVAEIEGYQKIIDGAKQVVENYKPSIRVKEEWEMVELGSITTFVQGINTAIDKLNYVEHGVKVLQANNIYLGHINFDSLKFITKEEFDTINSKYKPTKDDVLYSNIGARFGYASNVDFDDEFTFSWNVLRLIINDNKKTNKYYLKVILNQESIRQKVIRKNASSTMPFISGKELKLISIPIAPISEQQAIVDAIEEEMQLVNGNKRLIEIFEQKIKDKIGEVWGVKEEVMMAAEPVAEYE